MKIRVSVLLTLAAILPFGLFAKDSEKNRTAPVLRVDKSLVTEGKTPMVASYADVIEPVEKAVVSVYSTKLVKERVAVNPLLRQLFGDIPDQEREHEERGLGSGVIISPDGYILTNNHVVQGADELEVSLWDDRKLTAKVIGSDPKTDIAVIKIDSSKLPTLPLADSDNLRVGDIVFAVGNPLGVGQTVTMGIVSAKGRSIGILEDVAGYETFIQTDAAINMGNSGGALVDAKGRLVGINAAILSPSRGNIGIGFAVPINLAASIMKSLIETGTVARGYLGVQTQSLTPELAESFGLSKDLHGMVVTEVSAGSPAEKAGLKHGDVLLAFNGRPVSSFDDLRLSIAQMSPGSTVKIQISRNGKERMLEATLGKFDENPNALITGVNVTPLNNDLRRRLGIPIRIGSGLVVTSIDDDSPYADRLAVGVVILQVDREDVNDLESARQQLTPGRHMLFVYYRGAVRYIGIEVK